MLTRISWIVFLQPMRLAFIKCAQQPPVADDTSEIFIKVDFATLGEASSIGTSGVADAERYKRRFL